MTDILGSIAFVHPSNAGSNTLLPVLGVEPSQRLATPGHPTGDEHFV
ncbi:hypothetical protein [Jannaschia rubra]|nr:hypothetical protein [Jannaschia rubra]